METTVTITPSEALTRLAGVLADYRRVRRQTPAAVLVRAARNVSIGLYGEFGRVATRAGAPASEARARSYRLGNRLYSGALKPLALARATAMMGGLKSILVAPNPDGSFSFVRTGARGRRIRYRPGRASSPVAGTDPRFQNQGYKRLNVRAVATFFELRLREHGRRFLAVAWLQKRFQSRALTGYVPAGTAGFRAGIQPSNQFGGRVTELVNANPRSFLGTLGRTTLRDDGDTASLALISYVPGTASVGASRGIFARVLNAVADDMAAFAARVETDQLATALASAARP